MGARVGGEAFLVGGLVVLGCLGGGGGGCPATETVASNNSSRTKHRKP